MKQIQLTEKMLELDEVSLNEQETLKVSKFIAETYNILNIGAVRGHIKYEGLAHFKKVQKAISTLLKFGTSKLIWLEDSDYRILFGDEDNPGILRQYGGWLLNNYTNEFLNCWENAITKSIEEFKEFVKNEGK